jgi:hypothetical protein
MNEEFLESLLSFDDEDEEIFDEDDCDDVDDDDDWPEQHGARQNEEGEWEV